MTTNESLKRLKELNRQCVLLARMTALLRWDQETYLPAAATEERADQLALLESIRHKRLIDPEIGQLLDSLGSTPENPSGDERLKPLDRDFLRLLRRDYERDCRLPADFVADEARSVGLSQAAWAKARANDDFASFKPHLEKMLDFARRRGGYWGFSNPYEGLLDKHEEGMTEMAAAAVLMPLAEGLKALVSKISDQPLIDTAFLNLNYELEKQKSFNVELAESLGFNLNRGRLDLSNHPFTTSLGDSDVRITTRYFVNNPMSAIFSTIHETGHAIYEQSFDPAIWRTCLADGSSMGIHESQSRLWENVIGRSRSFWKGRYPLLQKLFADNLGQVQFEAFYRAINEVKPSLIRVDADELSYSLHIVLRFNLECRLFAGTLAIDDLPTAWRSGMADLLGIDVPSDRDGVLQDVHWSVGAFGYFPSYAFGNIYALQLWQQFCVDHPNYKEFMEEGKLSSIHDWFYEHVHRYGRRLKPEEILKNATGESLNPKAFISYLKEKYSDVYGLDL